MTEAEIEAVTRDAARERANSSNPRVCLVCGMESYTCWQTHIHTDAECWQTREAHGVAPDAAWPLNRNLPDDKQQ